MVLGEGQRLEAGGLRLEGGMVEGGMLPARFVNAQRAAEMVIATRLGAHSRYRQVRGAARSHGRRWRRFGVGWWIRLDGIDVDRRVGDRIGGEGWIIREGRWMWKGQRRWRRKGERRW